MDGYQDTYNGGLTIGVQPFKQSSTRTGEFMSGATTTVNPGNARTLQQTNPGGYRPSSVLNPLAGNPNGQSTQTFEQNRMLNYYRQ